MSIWAVTVLFDRRLVLLHRFTCFWASLYTWVNPQWPVTIDGREKIRDDATYVMVANHQSLLDILVLFRIFTHFKWVSKIENFRVPCVGWNMTLNRYIKLRRGDRESVEQMMAACERDAARGHVDHDVPGRHALEDGRAPAFKTGAFELALRTQRAAAADRAVGHQRHPAQARLRPARPPPDLDHHPRPDPPDRFQGLDAKALTELHPPNLRRPPGGERGRSSEWTGCGLEGQTWAAPAARRWQLDSPGCEVRPSSPQPVQARTVPFLRVC